MSDRYSVIKVAGSANKIIDNSPIIWYDNEVCMVFCDKDRKKSDMIAAALNLHHKVNIAKVNSKMTKSELLKLLK